MLQAAFVEPELFPLSKTMILRLVEDRHLTVSIPPVALTSLEEQMTYVQQQFDTVWSPVLQEVACLRERASELLWPVFKSQEPITEDWLREMIQANTPALVEKKGGTRGIREAYSDETFRRWRTGGLLRETGKNRLDFEATLAILIMRMADTKRAQGFLPFHERKPSGFKSAQDRDLPSRMEPYMYVWRQDAPNTPAIPCGLPLSDDIPNAAFLYSRWRMLGVLHDDWLPYGNLGSVRWRGTIQERNTLLWNLSEQELAQWDPQIAPLGNDILDTVARMTRHTLANLILLRMASQIFQKAAISAQ